MKLHKLMIKTHNETGFKYLCYTKKSGSEYESYLGSGKIWKRHIEKYGSNITTELLFDSDNYEEFVKVAIETSMKYNIVESKDWANLRIECGDGGDTVSKKMWITNGTCDVYLDKMLPIPLGWKRGRSNCVFNNSDRQKEFGARVDQIKKSESLKTAWELGKFNNRDTSNLHFCGENNPMKNIEMRKHMSNVAKNRTPETKAALGKASGEARKGKKRGPYKKKNNV